MQLFGKNLSKEVAVVAEIGVNHEGDVEVASSLLELAAGAGVDAVKFQTYTPEKFISTSTPERFERVKRFALDENAFLRLSEEAEKLRVAMFSTAVTEDSVALVNKIGQAIKIASGDLTFEPVIRAAAQTGKPIIVSTGLGIESEIDQAVSWVREEIGSNSLSECLVLMHCVSAYPTPLDQTNVRSVPYLATRYGVPTGYSNHAIEVEACLAAVALGACVLEVHITDCKSERMFHDHGLSFEIDELAKLVDMVPRIRASLGEFRKERQVSELPLLDVARKGLVAAHDLQPGTILKQDHVMFARPATEFPASALPKIIGSRLKIGLRRGEIIPKHAVEAVD